MKSPALLDGPMKVYATRDGAIDLIQTYKPRAQINLNNKLEGTNEEN